MLLMFDFAVTQLRYIKAAMDQIPSYRPDGLAPADVTAMVTSAATPRANYIAGKLGIDAARATRRVSIETLHDACVDFTAQARNRFRKDKVLMERIERLPVEDQTFQQTMTRADVIVPFWTGLPLVGTPPAAFTVGQGTSDLSLAGFTALVTAAKAADEAIPAVDEVFQKAEGTLNGLLATFDDFTGPAIAYGKDRYAEGSMERNVIDAIPQNPPQSVPGKAVLSATEENNNTMLFTFDASGATSFDLFQRILPDGEWTVLVDDTIERTFFLENSQPEGDQEFKVRGRNARGQGPESDVLPWHFGPP